MTVSGDDWRGQLAWNAGTCALFDGTVRVTDESVEVAGECLEPAQQRWDVGSQVCPRCNDETVGVAEAYCRGCGERLRND